MRPFLIHGGAAPNLYFLVFEMIVLRCTLPLALKLGVRLADTERHLERLIAAEAAIRVDSCTLPLFWPWQLGRQDRAETRRNAQRGQ